jgi:hypothetical protein
MLLVLRRLSFWIFLLESDDQFYRRRQGDRTLTQDHQAELPAHLMLDLAKLGFEVQWNGKPG